jgi:lactoylglutathione lyase
MKYEMSVQRVFCLHWEECVLFYKDTIGLPMKFKDDSLGWAEFDLGGASIAVERMAQDDTEAVSLVGRFVGLSFHVEDLGAVYQELKEKGVEFEGPPEVQPWGGALAHFKDPDRNIITLSGGIST